jgi:hypothetical protein
MFTALDLANRALIVLGEPRLTGFDQGGSVAALINDVLPATLRQFLKEDDWAWARKRAELTEDTALTHFSGFDYAYDLPSDMLQPRLIYGDNELELVYEIEGAHLFTDYAPFTNSDGTFPRIVYTADCLTDTVGDGTGYATLTTGYETLIPPEWAKAFGYTLASEIVWGITKNPEVTQRVRTEEVFLHVTRAKQMNAITTPGYGPPELGWGDDFVPVRPQPRRT